MKNDDDTKALFYNATAYRALWREGHPERDLTMPDHADLVVWLLEQLDWYKDQLAMANEHFQASERDLADARAEREQYQHARDATAGELATARAEVERLRLLLRERATLFEKAGKNE